jgi:hypothetical protein
MDVLILFLVILVFWVFLRMQGGKGLTISFKPPKFSTTKGKRYWITTWILYAILFAALVNVKLNEIEAGKSVWAAISPLIIIAGILIVFYEFKKK